MNINYHYILINYQFIINTLILISNFSHPRILFAIFNSYHHDPFLEKSNPYRLELKKRTFYPG